MTAVLKPDFGSRAAPARPRRVPAAVDSLAPADVAAEEAVLGSLLIMYGQEIADVSRILEPRHFSREVYAQIYGAMLDLYRDGTGVDMVTMHGRIEEMIRAGDIDDHPSGFAFVLATLIDRVPIATNAIYYAGQVREAALRRDLIAAAGRIAREAYDAPDGAGTALDRARAMMDQLDADVREISTGDPAVYLAALMDERVKGYPTGLAILDHWLGGEGLRPERMLALSGDTGCGKSWLITRIIIAAAEAGARCADFTLEMSGKQRVVRYAAALHGPRAFRLQSPFDRWDDNDRRIFGETSEWLRAHNVRIFDDPASAYDIQAQVRKHGFEVAAIDYYQNLDEPPDAGGDEIRVDKINSRILEKTAKAGSGCCLIVVGQRNESSKNMHFGQWLKRRADAAIKIQQPDEAPAGQDSIMEMVMEKNRWGVDAKAGGRARFYVDKGRGKWTPVASGGIN